MQHPLEMEIYMQKQIGQGDFPWMATPAGGAHRGEGLQGGETEG